jgi:hypothetical protein
VLVEGDEEVRRVLELLSCQVLVAASRRQALAMCQSPRWPAFLDTNNRGRDSHQVDLMVADLSLRRKEGPQDTVPHEGRQTNATPEMAGEALERALTNM